MNRFAAVMVAALALSACGAGGKAAPKLVSDKVSLKSGQTFRFDADKGEVTIVPLAKGPLTYDIEFQPDRGSAPSQKDYDGSTALYSPAQGLIVRTGEHFGAKVRLGVPAGQPVEALLESGVMVIGRLTGKLEAKVQTGTLDYDAGALPADACVSASTNVGVVENKRDFRCKPGKVTLHVNTGTLAVK